MKISMFRRAISYMAAIATTMATLAAISPPAAAQAPAVVERVVRKTDNWDSVFINSPAMGRTIQVDVLHPANEAPRPTLYLLDGNAADENQGQSTWTLRTDAASYMKDKAVNVVMPVGGGGTFYTDWLKDDPKVGRHKWETFLAKEIPPLINRLFHGNGTNGVAGLSMGAQAAATLAFRHPALYRALGSYSGCLLSDDVGQATVRAAVHARGGNPDNMWGPIIGPGWAAHDPSNHTDQLRGKTVYISTGRGVPGPADARFDARGNYPRDLPAAIALEEVVHTCTLGFEAKLRLRGIPATVRYTAIGTHSWPYWQNALHDSWPILSAGLGL